MSYSLQQMAEFLAPPEDYVNDCKKVADELFNLIRRKSMIEAPADRCRIVGGLAKKTSTSVKMDADLVVFVNVAPGNIMETKKKVLNEWQRVILDYFDPDNADICLTNSRLRIKSPLRFLAEFCSPSESSFLSERKIKKSKNSLQFEFNNVEIDLLVAINFDTNPEIQHKLVMKHIKTSPDPMNTSGQMSSELVELSLKFFKNKSKFCHDLARLAKFWSQTIIFTEYVSGKSTIMETVAVKAAMQEESRRPGHPDYQAAFKDFLEMISDISNIKLVFYDNYNVSDVPSSVSNQVPLILDPTNPYNNYLSLSQEPAGYGNNNVKMTKQFLTMFSDCAKNTLSIVENKGSDFFFSTIFLPQPVLWKSTVLKVVVPQDYHVSCEVCPYTMPRLEIRGFVSDSVHRMLDILLKVYTCVVKSAEGDKPSIPDADMMEKVKEEMEKINRNTSWSCSIGGPPKERAVTLLVPLSKVGHGEVEQKQGRAVNISFNIKVVE